MTAYDENIDDDDIDEELDALFDDNTSNGSLSDEFRPIPDDEEENDSELGEAHRATIPLWLKTDYADIREWLIAEMKRNLSRKPTCYDKGTFIDGSQYPFFDATKRFKLQPEHFYKPKYFVFIPHLLTGTPIRCPQCLSASQKGKDGQSACLTPNGFPKAPRQVVDVDENIYIIGYRYYCRTCKKSYQSWSPALHAALPRPLAQEFTHHLTFRSGLTDRVVALMRSCFLQGIGPYPFAQILRTNHLRRYEQLHLQYLEFLYTRHSTPLHFTGRFQPFSAYNDRNGYAGYTPSGRYIRDFYVRFMESHATEIDQYTAMLSANILQVDHSFKVCTSGVLGSVLILITSLFIDSFL